MKRYMRVLIPVLSAVFASSVYGAAGDPPAPKPETLKPAEPPRTPSTGAPAGFPVLAIPLAIVIGAAVAVGTQDDEAVFPASTGTTGTQ